MHRTGPSLKALKKDNPYKKFGSGTFGAPLFRALVDAGVDGRRHACCSEHPVQHLVLNDRMAGGFTVLADPFSLILHKLGGALAR